MKKLTPYIFFTFLLVALLISGVACHLIMPFEPGTADGEPTYLCSAQIYRDLPGGNEFTEEWEFYNWPDLKTCEYYKNICTTNDDCNTSQEEKCKVDPHLYCTEKIETYINDYMAPGFMWNYRNLTTTPIVKEDAVDCAFTWDDLAIQPPTYGAPLGAELRWNYPPGTQAYVYFSIVDKDGVTRIAEPMVANAYVDFAERTGLWDESVSLYILGKRNIRFSDIFIELDTPFELGPDLTINKFYIQSVGTVIAEDVGGTSYQVKSLNSKYFLYAAGERSGENKATSFCFANDYLYGFNEYQGPPNAYFTLSINSTTMILGHEMTVKISLSKPAAPYQFVTNQPYIAFLGDIEATSPLVDLAPGIAIDHDSDLQEILWFEDFEASNERFLGEGNPLEDVPFSVGDHQVTAVAYDSKGSYNSATVTVKGVPNVAPVAYDDSYSTSEDTDLAVVNPGVLGNDTDANGDALAAEILNEPSHGLLLLNLYGGFVYYPEDDWCGQDSFTYRAHDGTDYSNTATVSIAVSCINDPPEAEDDSYSGDQCTLLSISAPGVLNNDVDVENDPLTAIKLSDPSNGSLTLNSNGSFTYVPDNNWTGTDDFTYKANDGMDDSNSAIVTITINELDPSQQIEKCLKQQLPPNLNPGIEKSLLMKLNAAIAQYNSGNVTAVCNILEAFKNDVKALMSGGVLSQNEGQKLLDLADDIKAEMNC